MPSAKLSTRRLFTQKKRDAADLILKFVTEDGSKRFKLREGTTVPVDILDDELLFLAEKMVAVQELGGVAGKGMRLKEFKPSSSGSSDSFLSSGSSSLPELNSSGTFSDISTDKEVSVDFGPMLESRNSKPFGRQVSEIWAAHRGGKNDGEVDKALIVQAKNLQAREGRRVAKPVRQVRNVGHGVLRLLPGE